MMRSRALGGSWLVTPAIAISLMLTPVLCHGNNRYRGAYADIPLWPVSAVAHSWGLRRHGTSRFWPDAPASETEAGVPAAYSVQCASTFQPRARTGAFRPRASGR